MRARVKDDLRLTAVELAQDVRNFLLEGELLLTVIGAFAQHKRFDDASQEVGRQLLVWNLDRIVSLVVQVKDFQ